MNCRTPAYLTASIVFATAHCIWNIVEVLIGGSKHKENQNIIEKWVNSPSLRFPAARNQITVMQSTRAGRNGIFMFLHNAHRTFLQSALTEGGTIRALTVLRMNHLSSGLNKVQQFL